MKLDRYLAPGDSLSEILFGLIMTLTFTLGAGILVREDPDAARELLVATVGCNVAWGLIDALMYLAGQRFERGRRARLVDAIRAEASEEKATRRVAGELDELLERVTEESDRASLYRKIARAVREGEPPSTRLTREDVYGAVASFFLVFFSSIPAALPFVFFDEAWTRPPVLERNPDWPAVRGRLPLGTAYQPSAPASGFHSHGRRPGARADGDRAGRLSEFRTRIPWRRRRSGPPSDRD